jgi:TPR repeat protein
MAALEIQAIALDSAAAQALFLRSCRLGYASGCTNAAAGRLQGGPMDQCSLRTFQQICDRAGDPWACTMLGSALERGEATSRDPARARAALAKACHADQEDSACQAAKAILSRLAAPP